MMIQRSVWNITALKTGTMLLEDKIMLTLLGLSFYEIRKLDITLRLPIAVFTAADH
jgi:hypothetical protein